MASLAVIGACVLIVFASWRISRGRRLKRPVGWMPGILIVLALGLVAFAAVPSFMR